MAIRKWHVGKIVLLWAWGLVLCIVVIQIIIHLDAANWALGLALVVVLLATLVALSVITWKWFGGKEQ